MPTARLDIQDATTPMIDARGRPPQSPREEVANAITHGVGALLAIVLLVVLIVLAAKSGDPWRITTLAIFGGTLVTTYVVSTIYHSVRRPRAKSVLRMLDHVSIYLLIAGTYTPIALVTLGGGWGWALFLLAWTFALIGVVFKIVTIGRFERLSLALFLLMGWLVVLAAPVVVRSMSTTGLIWLAAGGAAYTGGVVFYRWRRLHYHHAIWHGFVMAGSGCHAVAMFCDVLPMA